MGSRSSKGAAEAKAAAAAAEQAAAVARQALGVVTAQLAEAQSSHEEMMAHFAQQAKRDEDRMMRQSEQFEQQAKRDEDRQIAEQAIAAERLRLEQQQAALKLAEEQAASKRRVAEAVEEERARAHAEKLRQWTELNREYPVPEFLKPFVTVVLEDAAADEGQTRRVNVAVVGDSGVGKSSLITVIMGFFGTELAGNTPSPQACVEGDGTRKPTPYVLGDFEGTVTIWDLPGQGTALIPAKSYLRDMGLKYYDAVLIATDGRWSENDTTVLQAIRFAQIPCNIVRTKIDQAVENGEHDHGWTQEQTLENVRKKLEEQLDEHDSGRVHLVTTRKKYWTGLHKFGAVDDVCGRVKRQIEDAQDGVGAQARKRPLCGAAA